MSERQYTPADRLLIDIHQGLGQLFGGTRASGSTTGHHSAETDSPPGKPDSTATDTGAPLDDAERRHSAALMRVNHAGEIAAQALYHGQSVTARSASVRQHMRDAAAEEQAHLDWCAARVHELGEDTSRLAPLWYAGSFAIGALAGLAGDRSSLGFVAETEKQVVEHLEEHLEKLPDADQDSRDIVRRMRDDEARHGDEALQAGGAELPAPVRDAMKLVSKIMTRTAYWL